MNIGGVEIVDARPVGGGDICAAFAGSLADGRRVFVKTMPAPPAGFFTAEADGLARLRFADAPPVPQVIAAGEDGLVLDWVEPGRPDPAAARAFGRALAGLHSHGAGEFGADGDGYIASLPLPNRRCADWPTFYAEQRLLPFAQSLPAPVRRLVERLCAELARLGGPAVAPARVHGDLWSGNLLWSRRGDVWLVDGAAAHDGHPETDLAMLALFGAAHLDEIVAGYEDVCTLPAGWRGRQRLHQLHPLLVHAALFGGGYVDRVGDVARRLLDR